MKNEIPLGTASFATEDDLDRECLMALSCIAMFCLALIGIGVGIGYLIWG